MLLSVYDLVGAPVERLADLGVLDNTYIAFTSGEREREE
jgi:hypothetical protein